MLGAELNSSSCEAVKIGGLELRPPSNVGMKNLDRSAFSLEIGVPCVTVESKFVGKFRSLMKSLLLCIPQQSCVVACPGEPHKRKILFDPALNDDDLAKRVDCAAAEAATKCPLVLERHTVTLDYSYWTMDKILRSILPPKVPIIGAFESVGHIAHLNLRPEQLPFESIIGEVLLDKNGQIKTVVNKLDSIDNVFRFFKMNVIAGVDKLITTLSENNCRFTFDYSQVYWNSRLQFEHARLISLFNEKDVVFDVFAGVGPFAVAAAKNRGCRVFANDLNPNSFKWLLHNVGANKVGNLVAAYNLDGRDFIKKFADILQGSDLQPSGSSKKRKLTRAELPTHYIMNLPASAETFVDAFKGLFNGVADPTVKLPFVHVYCFSKNPPPGTSHHQQAQANVERNLGCSIDGPETSIYLVRNVAPGKRMMCVTFRLPAKVF